MLIPYISCNFILALMILYVNKIKSLYLIKKELQKFHQAKQLQPDAILCGKE